jgi:hypothetical protein
MHMNHLQFQSSSLVSMLLIGFVENQSCDVFRQLYNDVQEFVHAFLSDLEGHFGDQGVRRDQTLQKNRYQAPRGGLPVFPPIQPRTHLLSPMISH